jgi:hypothetical protein
MSLSMLEKTTVLGLEGGSPGEISSRRANHRADLPLVHSRLQGTR